MDASARRRRWATATVTVAAVVAVLLVVILTGTDRSPLIVLGPSDEAPDEVDEGQGPPLGDTAQWPRLIHLEVSQLDEGNGQLEHAADFVFSGTSPTDWTLEERFAHGVWTCYRQEGEIILATAAGERTCEWDSAVPDPAGRDEDGELQPVGVSEFFYVDMSTLVERDGERIPAPAAEFASAAPDRPVRAIQVHGRCRGSFVCEPADPGSPRIERWVFDPVLDTVVFYEAREGGTVVERVEAVEVTVGDSAR